MILLCFFKAIPTSATMFNADKFISCFITFHFKDLKNNYGTCIAFWRPRQGSNGINSGYVRWNCVYAGQFIAATETNAALCRRINKENIVLKQPLSLNI